MVIKSPKFKLKSFKEIFASSARPIIARISEIPSLRISFSRIKNNTKIGVKIIYKPAMKALLEEVVYSSPIV